MTKRNQLLLVGAAFLAAVTLIFGIPYLLGTDEHFRAHDVLGIQLFQDAWK